MGANSQPDRPAMAVAASRMSEILLELEDAVLLARLPPGQIVTHMEFARQGRTSIAVFETLLPELVAKRLVEPQGDKLVVKPLDKDAIFSALPRRMELELLITGKAAAGATDAQIVEMKASEALQRRCAMVGDMDGMIIAERNLERLLVDASGLHVEGAELKSIKVEFRRAWCAANRLRNFTNVANIRTALVAAIADRDVEGAQAQVRVFFDHLMRTY